MYIIMYYYVISHSKVILVWLCVAEVTRIDHPQQTCTYHDDAGNAP